MSAQRDPSKLFLIHLERMATSRCRVRLNLSHLDPHFHCALAHMPLRGTGGSLFSTDLNTYSHAANDISMSSFQVRQHYIDEFHRRTLTIVHSSISLLQVNTRIFLHWESYPCSTPTISSQEERVNIFGSVSGNHAATETSLFYPRNSPLCIAPKDMEGNDTTANIGECSLAYNYKAHLISPDAQQ